MILLMAFAGIAALLLVAGIRYELLGRSRDKARFPVPGRLVEIGNGRRMHVYELGSADGPTVILEAGLCATSLNWRALQKAIAPFARVLAYDRAGLGWSDAAPGARSALNLTVELKTMLEAAQIEPPYVLVGHSFGAWIVQRFADLYPGDVSAVILLDPPQLEECSEIPRGIRLAKCAEFLAHCGVLRTLIKLLSRKALSSGQLTRRVTRQVAKLPRELWPVVAAHWCNPSFYRTAIAYLEALPATIEEMAAVAPLKDVPTVVISANENRSIDRISVEAIAPGARHIRATESGHWIHLDEPELVIGIVRDMVACEVAYLVH